MINVVIIDDHPMLTNAVSTWLFKTRRFLIAGTAKTLSEGVNLIEELNPLPEIIILDVSLGSQTGFVEDGLTLIPRIKEISEKRNAAFPGILVFTMHEDQFLIRRAMELGAKAYVSKSSESSEFFAAIDALLAGNTYNAIQTQNKQQANLSLTNRENEIAALVKQSFSAKQIAKRLNLSIRTIEKHLEHIYIKTNTGSWEELNSL